MQTIKIIEDRLTKSFSPKKLIVQDDSHLHVGHVGSQDGAGHFTVIISSQAFIGLTKIQTHRLIYAALSDLIPKTIHALQIKIEG